MFARLELNTNVLGNNILRCAFLEDTIYSRSFLPKKSFAERPPNTSKKRTIIITLNILK